MIPTTNIPAIDTEIQAAFDEAMVQGLAGLGEDAVKNWTPTAEDCRAICDAAENTIVKELVEKLVAGRTESTLGLRVIGALTEESLDLASPSEGRKVRNAVVTARQALDELYRITGDTPSSTGTATINDLLTACSGSKASIDDIHTLLRCALG